MSNSFVKQCFELVLLFMDGFCMDLEVRIVASDQCCQLARQIACTANQLDTRDHYRS